MSDKLTVTEAIGELATAGALSPAAAYLLALRSESSRYAMARKLDKAARELGGDGGTWDTFPWEQLQPVHVQGLMSKLAASYSPAYCNTILAAIRGTMRAANDAGLVDDRTLRLIEKVRRVAGGSSEPAGRYVASGERTALMQAALDDQSDTGARDAAILACAYPGGLRRAEIAGLRRENVTTDGDLVILAVTGKGRKRRSVPLDNGGAGALADWLAVRGDGAGPLFWRGKRGSRLCAGLGLSSQAVYDILARLAKRAGVAALVPHDLRRSVASDGLDQTDAVAVARLLGHASTVTTAKYDRRGERAVRKTAAALHIAYTKRRGIV